METIKRHDYLCCDIPQLIADFRHNSPGLPLLGQSSQSELEALMAALHKITDIFCLRWHSKISQPVLSVMDDDFKTQIRQIVLPLLYGEPHRMHPIGTAVVVCGKGRTVIAMTAKHNLELIHSIQNPYQTHHPTTPMMFRPEKEKKIILPIGGGIFLPVSDGKNKALVQVTYGVGSELTDVAYLIAVVPDEVAFEFKYCIAIDASPLNIEEELVVMGYNKLSDSQHLHNEVTGDTDVKINPSLELRSGKVIGRENSSFARWPVARTDIPLTSGMSGGPAISKSRWTREIVVRGLACSDITDDPENMENGMGYSLISELWPSLITPLDIRNARTGIAGKRPIFQLINEGMIQYSGTLDDFAFFSRIDTRERVVQWGSNASWLPRTS